MNTAPHSSQEFLTYDPSLEIPEHLITETDRNIDDQRYRMRELDNASGDQVGLYHGYPKIQEEMLIMDNANWRLSQSSPFVYAALLAARDMRRADAAA